MTERTAQFIIPISSAPFWRCPPNAVHAGTVEFRDLGNGHPLCPVCGRVT